MEDFVNWNWTVLKVSEHFCQSSIWWWKLFNNHLHIGKLFLHLAFPLLIILFRQKSAKFMTNCQNMNFSLDIHLKMCIFLVWISYYFMKIWQNFYQGCYATWKTWRTWKSQGIQKLTEKWGISQGISAFYPKF